MSTSRPLAPIAQPRTEGRVQVALAGMAAGTPVLTLDGELPVQFLAPGDRVVTRSGARTIEAVEVEVVQDATMICIAASALGHDRPEAVLWVAPDQPLLLRDWRARALFGRESAIIPADRLVDGGYIRRVQVTEARLFRLHFADEEVIYAAGVELPCPPAG